MTTPRGPSGRQEKGPGGKNVPAGPPPPPGQCAPGPNWNPKGTKAKSRWARIFQPIIFQVKPPENRHKHHFLEPSAKTWLCEPMVFSPAVLGWPNLYFSKPQGGGAGGKHVGWMDAPLRGGGPLSIGKALIETLHKLKFRTDMGLPLKRETLERIDWASSKSRESHVCQECKVGKEKKRPPKKGAVPLSVVHAGVSSQMQPEML